MSPIGFCLLELAEAKMVTTLAGKSFLRVDEVQHFELNIELNNWIEWIEQVLKVLNE